MQVNFFGLGEDCNFLIDGKGCGLPVDHRPITCASVEPQADHDCIKGDFSIAKEWGRPEYQQILSDLATKITGMPINEILKQQIQECYDIVNNPNSDPKNIQIANEIIKLANIYQDNWELDTGII
jgi:hypothetical protein